MSTENELQIAELSPDWQKESMWVQTDWPVTFNKSVEVSEGQRRNIWKGQRVKNTQVLSDVCVIYFVKQ